VPKQQPGTYTSFKGLWARGSRDTTPPDHFYDCLNLEFLKGVNTRQETSQYNATTNIVRMALYKPNPPFSGNNVPRIIALRSNGDLIDLLLGTTIYSNASMTDFGFVNFFGRCYISPSNGVTGLNGVNVKVYEGSGVVRDACGTGPTLALSAVSSGAGKIGVGTTLFSYAWETSSGFITKPAPFTGVDTFGTANVALSSIAVGPAGTVARWVIATKIFPLATIPPAEYASRALVSPIFFVTRIADNTTTTYNASFYDEELVDEASYLFNEMTAIPSGVNLLDYNSRLVSFGEFSNPSLVRISAQGDPEQISSTGGFLITDPTDSTGVKNGIEFRGSLYLFKQDRGIIADDNDDDPTSWKIINFEKSQGSDVHGVATILDAKGASSEGFIAASKGALNFFNGTMLEPELSWKVRDYWLRINPNFFNLVQVVNDPINRRIYVLLPLDNSTVVNYILFGDYRDGLNAVAIKWSPWKLKNNPTSMLVYSDFTSNIPSTKTRVSNLTNIVSVNIGAYSSDEGTAIDSYFILAPLRFGIGISQFDHLNLRAKGPVDFEFTAFGEDDQISSVPTPLSIANNTPGREYSQLFNLVSEQCSMKIRSNVVNKYFAIDYVRILGYEIAAERPR